MEKQLTLGFVDFFALPLIFIVTFIVGFFTNVPFQALFFGRYT